MEAFSSITSTVLSLPMNDVDTDMIIPASFLTSVSKGGFGEHVFQRLRDQDTAFPFCNPEAKKAKILLVGYNFGCGSSREHAVWALKEWGIRAIVGESFADIFASNSAKNGLVLVELSADKIAQIKREYDSGSAECTVDLPNEKIVTASGVEYSFSFDPFRKHCIVHGLDDIDYIRSSSEAVQAFRATQKRTFDMSKVKEGL